MSHMQKLEPYCYHCLVYKVFWRFIILIVNGKGNVARKSTELSMFFLLVPSTDNATIFQIGSFQIRSFITS